MFRGLGAGGDELTPAILTRDTHSVKIRSMNVEAISGSGVPQRDLHSRAAQHAALAEPLRLRIADLLTLSDLSSSELRTQLGIRSNLLAHHLSVLEEAGLVQRRQSEGDRRRSYATLTSEHHSAAVSGPSPSHATQGDRPRRVVFICTGNSTRSPFAAARWNAGWGDEFGVRAVSAGTHPAPAPSPRSVKAAAALGVDLSAHTPRLIGTLNAEDLVVVVCDRAYEELSKGFRQHQPRIRHWSVPNPGPAGSTAAYENCFEDLSRRVEALGSSRRC